MNATAPNHATGYIARTTAAPRDTGNCAPPPVAGVVSRADAVTNKINGALDRIATLRSRINTIAQHLHGPRPEQARASTQAKDVANSTMNCQEDAVDRLHAEISDLEEAVSAL